MVSPHPSNTGDATERTWGVHFEDQFTLLLATRGTSRRCPDAQDRRARLRVVGQYVAPWIADWQLRSRPAATGGAGTNPLPDEPGPASGRWRLGGQKTLEGASITLASVATDIFGKSGREILAALVAGETEGAELFPNAPTGDCARNSPAPTSGPRRARRSASALPGGPAIGPYRLP